MRRMFTAGVVLILAAATTQSVHAQGAADRRQGFWLNAGLGWGSLGVRCSYCGSTTRESAVAGNFALGGTVGHSLLLGVESDGWSKDESGVTLNSWNLSGVAYYYPVPAGGLFLKGGVGVGGWTASAGGSSDTESGLGFIAGLGYDIPVGKKVSISPTATFRWSKVVDDIEQNVIQLGASFTLH